MVYDPSPWKGSHSGLCPIVLPGTRELDMPPTCSEGNRTVDRNHYFWPIQKFNLPLSIFPLKNLDFWILRLFQPTSTSIFSSQSIGLTLCPFFYTVIWSSLGKRSVLRESLFPLLFCPQQSAFISPILNLFKDVPGLLIFKDNYYIKP